ncbi:MAG: hypothetical protein J5994_10335 [Ruminococcus sp.]|nr:hypothetical protein [Ruminococcus sp.]
MKIIIDGSAKEVIALVLEVQGRQPRQLPINCDHIFPDIERMNKSAIIRRELNETTETNN